MRDWDELEKDTGASGWDFPDRTAVPAAPVAPRRTPLDGLMQVVKVIGLSLLFAGCLFAPADGSDNSGFPGWYWVALGLTGATGVLLFVLAVVYQRHRSPVLDRPAWEVEGRRAPLRRFTGVQVEPGHFEVRDEASVVADYRRSRSSLFKDLRIAGRSYRLRRSSNGMKLVAEGESNPVLRSGKKGQITLDNGAIFTLAGRDAPVSTSWVALQRYRMQRYADCTGTEFMVLRWRESAPGDRLPEAEARIYGPDDISTVLPMICFALAQFQGNRGRRESR